MYDFNGMHAHEKMGHLDNSTSSYSYCSVHSIVWRVKTSSQK